MTTGAEGAPAAAAASPSAPRTASAPSVRPAPAVSIADVVTSMLEGTGVAVAPAGSPLAVLQARHRASVIATRGAAGGLSAGGDIESHARQARRNGSIIATGSGTPGSPRQHHTNLEKFQMAQLAAREPWRVVLHKEVGSRSALDIMQLGQWIRDGLGRPGAPVIAAATPAANGASPSPVAGVSTAAPPAAAAPISPFLQQLPPLVLRGLCPDLGLLYLDKGEVNRLGRSIGYGEGYYIVLSGQVAVLESDPDAPPGSPPSRHGRSPSRTGHTRSPSPLSSSPTHRSFSSSPVGSAAATPRPSRPHTAANALLAATASRPSSGAHLSPHLSPRGAAHAPHFSYSLAATAPVTAVVPASPLAAGGDSSRPAQAQSATPAATEKRPQDGDRAADAVSPSPMWRRLSSAMRPPSSVEGLGANHSAGGDTAPSDLADDDGDDEGMLDERELHKGLHLLGGAENTPAHSRVHVDAGAGGRRWRVIQPGFGFGHAALLHAFNAANHAQKSGLGDEVKEAESLAEQLRTGVATPAAPAATAASAAADRPAPSSASATRSAHRRQHTHHSIDAGRPASGSMDDPYRPSSAAVSGTGEVPAGDASSSSPPSSSLRGSALEIAALGGLHGFIPASHVKCLGPRGAELLYIPCRTFTQSVARACLGKLNRRIEALRGIFLFNRWSFEKLSKFCMGLRRIHVPAGTHLYRQGDPIGAVGGGGGAGSHGGAGAGAGGLGGVGGGVVYFLERGEVLLEYNVSAGRSIVEKPPSAHDLVAPAGHPAHAHVEPPSQRGGSGLGLGLGAGSAAARSNTGVNVGAGPGGFSITGENYAHLQAEAAQFRARTRRRGSALSTSTLHHSTSASVSSATRRQRREAEEAAAEAAGADGTDSFSEEEDTLVEHAMRALNTGVGLGVTVAAPVAHRQRAAPEQLSELSEELAPQHKLMAAMQAQISGRRGEFGRGRGDVARRAQLLLALHRARSTIRYSKHVFRARAMPPSFARKRPPAEEEELQVHLLANAARERKKAEERSAAEAALAPPPSAADAAKAAMAAAAAASCASPPLLQQQVSSVPTRVHHSSTESGVSEMLAASKQSDSASRKQGVMYKLRHMQLVKNAARAERLGAMAEEEAEAIAHKQASERAAREQAEAFRKMVQANSALVKRNAINAAEAVAAASAAAAAAASSSSAHTHHSYVTLFPFCTYVGSLTPPSSSKRAGSSSSGGGGARRPAVQFFKLFLLHPRSLRLRATFEETLDPFGAGSSSAQGLVTSSSSTSPNSTGLFVSYGESASPTPSSHAWRGVPDAAENAIANHPSSRLSLRGRAGRGVVQHYALDIDPATDAHFRQPTAAGAALREGGCYYYVSVQCMFACTFTLKVDLVNTVASTSVAATTLTQGAAHAGTASASSSFTSDAQAGGHSSAGTSKHARTSSTAEAGASASSTTPQGAALLPPPSPPPLPSSSSLHRPHHLVPLALFTSARPTLFGELELLSTSALDSSGTRLTSARTLVPSTLLVMDRMVFFEHLKGELWSRLQSLIRKQKKIYMSLIAGSSALRYGSVGGTGAGSVRPSLHQRAMFVRARLPDASNLEARSALPSAMRSKNYRVVHSAMLGGGGGDRAPTAAAAGARGVAQVTVPSIGYMFPAHAESSSSASPSDNDEGADGGLENAARSGASSPTRSPRKAHADGMLVPAKLRSPQPYSAGSTPNTFFELFGLDALNESLTPALAALQHPFAHGWESHAFEVPNPAPLGGGGSGGSGPGVTVVQLSTAQEARFHFRTHALSSAAAERKKIRREKLLAKQRQPSPPPAGAPVSPSHASGPATSAHRAPTLADLSWEQYRAFLGLDRAALDLELAGLDVGALRAKLAAEESTQLRLESAMAEEEQQGSDGAEEEGEEDGDAAVLVEDDEDDEAVSDGSSSDSSSTDFFSSSDPPRQQDHHRRDHLAIGSHGKAAPRMPGASPQHYFHSHGHHLLYAGWGTPNARRLRGRDANRAAHKTLAERMQSRASKSVIGTRFDHVWHIERESERKWLASNARTAHIQRAMEDMQQLDGSRMASAALEGILAAAARELEDAVLARSESADTVLSDSLPRPAAHAPAAAGAAAATARSDSAPDLYPPSSSIHYGISAKGSQILEAQLPHLASMVVAAEDRMDPYGDSYLPSAVEQSVAAAAAAQAGLAIAPPPRRRIVGAPAFLPRPPPIRHSVLNDPDATEKVADPEPGLSVFRVSKRAVAATSAKTSARNGSHSARASMDFNSRPSTAAAVVATTDNDSAAAASRPGTAGLVDTPARPATAAAAATVPFSDQAHFPPQRYPPSAPTLMAVTAREPYSSEREQARPWQPHVPVSFRDRVGATKPAALRSSLSVWPDASMSNQPLAYNIRAAAGGGDLATPEHELLHIRGGWAPHKELHSTQLSHCVPCPPGSALAVARGHVAVPAPPVRPGSVTARARIGSAQVAKRRASSGSGASTARPSTAQTTASLHVILPSPSHSHTNEPEPDQGFTPLDLTGAAEATERDAHHDSAHPRAHAVEANAARGSAAGTTTGSTATTASTRSPAAVHSRLGSPSRPTQQRGSRSPSALASPARSPRRLTSSEIVDADTVALTPMIDAAMMVHTGADAASELSLQLSGGGDTPHISADVGFDPLSAWSVAPAPLTPSSSRPGTAPRGKASKSSRSRSGYAGLGELRRGRGASNRRRSKGQTGAKDPEATAAGTNAQPAVGTGVADVSARIGGVVTSTATMPFSAYFQAISTVDVAGVTSAPPRPATAAPTTETSALQLPAAASPTHQRRPSTSPSSGSQTLSAASAHPLRSRRPSRFFQCDANGVPRSGNTTPRASPESDATFEEESEEAAAARRARLAPSAEALQQSSLFKTSLNFRVDAHSRGRSMSVSHAAPLRADGALPPPPPPASLQSSDGRMSARLSPQLGAFEEAALRCHEPSTRWQLIDELYEKQRVDEVVHTIERIPLTRVTSEMQLLDHRGQPLPDRAAEPLSADGTLIAQARPNGASDESDTEDLSLLSPEEKAARWAARLAKQEARVAAEQAEADRRLREALDDADLEDDGEEGDDSTALGSDRARRRRLRLQRFGSLSLTEKGAAERMDLDAEAELLQQRMEEIEDAASPYAAGTGRIHQELKIMRKTQLDAKQKEMNAEILASAPQQQRRAAAFQALDEHDSQQPPPSSVPATATEAEGGDGGAEAADASPKPSVTNHTRQPSIMTISFDPAQISSRSSGGGSGGGGGVAANSASASASAAMHPVTAAGAPPPLQQHDLFRQKASEFARDHPVSPSTALRLLATDDASAKAAGTGRGRGSGEGAPGGGGGSRTARNQLAHAMRTPALSRSRKQLAASAQLQHIVSMDAGQATANHLAQLADELTRGSGEEKSADPQSMQTAQRVPYLNLTAVTATPHGSSSSGGRTYNTLHNATGFATWRPTSPLALHPTALLSSATPWQLARFQRHARREAQESARQAANAARLVAAEHARTQQHSAELAAHARALALAKHAPPPVTHPASSPDPVVQPHAPGGAFSIGPLSSSAHFLDKSVQHPLQRLKLKYQHAQSREQRNQRILQLQQAAYAESARAHDE